MKSAFLMIEMSLILSVLIMILNLGLSVWTKRTSESLYEWIPVTSNCEVLCAIDKALP